MAKLVISCQASSREASDLMQGLWWEAGWRCRQVPFNAMRSGLIGHGNDGPIAVIEDSVVLWQQGAQISERVVLQPQAAFHCQHFPMQLYQSQNCSRIIIATEGMEAITCITAEGNPLMWGKRLTSTWT